ncbi:MAG: protein arginine kinase [Clostridia bacterium]|nr:protein arginine kinase [Clostridia bacterium]MDE7182184.1 protein arginine kinase [Clostridia bacterium]
MDKTAEGIVVSTRVRLARNLEGYPFPSHLKDEKQAKEIIRLVSSGLSKLDEFRLEYMDQISDEQAVCLMENHLISPKLIRNKRFSAALINREENVSVMINEEDHLREQSIVKGLDLKLAYETMSEIDNHVAKSMKFAFDEQLGYLTACPTNLGTGLRASVMQFLPALTMNGLMPKLIRSINRLGLTVRGMYGEGSDAQGFLYQISNEVTLGVTEEEILLQVGEVVKKVCALEEAERNNIKNSDTSLDIQDECMRAYGVLTNCAKVSTSEFVKLISKVKLGACLGYIKLTDISEIDSLMVRLRPTNINAAANRPLTPLERDVYRARVASTTLKKLTV